MATQPTPATLPEIIQDLTHLIDAFDTRAMLAEHWEQHEIPGEYGSEGELRIRESLSDNLTRLRRLHYYQTQREEADTEVTPGTGVASFDQSEPI